MWHIITPSHPLNTSHRGLQEQVAPAPPHAGSVARLGRPRGVPRLSKAIPEFANLAPTMNDETTNWWSILDSRSIIKSTATIPLHRRKSRAAKALPRRSLAACPPSGISAFEMDFSAFDRYHAY
jgi:hypothetical protein